MHRQSIATAVVDSSTGQQTAELTRRRGILSQDVWLDDQTLLIATTPYFVAWRPATGGLFRVTDARSLGHNYWNISFASGTLAR